MLAVWMRNGKTHIFFHESTHDVRDVSSSQGLGNHCSYSLGRGLAEKNGRAKLRPLRFRLSLRAYDLQHFRTAAVLTQATKAARYSQAGRGILCLWKNYAIVNPVVSEPPGILTPRSGYPGPLSEGLLAKPEVFCLR